MPGTAAVSSASPEIKRTTVPMQYLECPRCRARFHAGFIYEPLERCPRCEEPFAAPDHAGGVLQRVLGRHKPDRPPDWEAITGSQYRPRAVTRPERDPRSGAPSPG